MKPINYPLGDPQAVKIHEEIVKKDNAYSLTVTLNPRQNHNTCCTQYRMLRHALKKAISACKGWFEQLMFTVEFTQYNNAHFHVYFTSNNITYFEQYWKKYIIKDHWIGKNYKINKVDEVTPELLKYPFKDIERTTFISKGIVFNPYHTVINGELGLLPDDNLPPQYKSVSLQKFIDWLNTQK